MGVGCVCVCFDKWREAGWWFSGIFCIVELELEMQLGDGIRCIIM